MSANNTENANITQREADIVDRSVGISKVTVAIIGGVGAVIGALAAVFTFYETLSNERTTWRVIKNEHLEDATKENPVPSYNHNEVMAQILSRVNNEIHAASSKVLEDVDGKLASLELKITDAIQAERAGILTDVDNKIAATTASTVRMVGETIERAISPLASREEVPGLIDLSPFVMSEELPDFAQFVRASQLPPPPDLSPYALKTEVISFGSQVRLVNIESGMSFWCGASNRAETSCLARPLGAATPWRLDRPN